VQCKALVLRVARGWLVLGWDPENGWPYLLGVVWACLCLLHNAQRVLKACGVSLLLV
jgi:hypothetical protein